MYMQLLRGVEASYMCVCVCAVGRNRCEIMCDSLQCLLILLTGERHTPVLVHDHLRLCTWR